MKVNFILDSNETFTPIQIAKGISDGMAMECLIEVVEFLELIIKQEKRRLSAQPELVRCKDCKWFGSIGCAIEVVDDSDKPTENDFCSFAERRTDE